MDFLGLEIGSQINLQSTVNAYVQNLIFISSSLHKCKYIQKGKTVVYTAVQCHILEVYLQLYVDKRCNIYSPLATDMLLKKFRHHGVVKPADALDQISNGAARCLNLERSGWERESTRVSSKED